MRTYSEFKRIGIFSDRLELVSLLIPIFFLLLVFVEVFVINLNMSSATRAILIGFAATFLLNSTHVGLTFSGWLTLPMIKFWLKNQFDQKIFLFTFIFSVFLLIGLFAFALNSLTLTAGSKPSIFILMSYDLIILWHSLGQTKGLSFLYNKKVVNQDNFPKEKKQVLLRFEAIERNGLFALLFLLFSLKIMLATGWHNHINLFLHIDEKQFKYLFFTICCLISCILIFLSMFLPGNKTYKPLFCLRYLLYAFLPISFIAGVALLAIHGIEYLFLNQQIVANTKLKSNIYRNWLRLSILICVVLFIIASLLPNGFGFLLFSLSPELATLGIFSAAIIMALTTIHVGFDKIFYRLSGSDYFQSKLSSILIK